jgi:hypothetical protein
MKRLWPVLALVFAAVVLAPSALAGMSLYRTDAQAEHFLEHGLHTSSRRSASMATTPGMSDGRATTIRRDTRPGTGRTSLGLSPALWP